MLKVVIRSRPARSTGLLMNASVMNTDRSGVFAAIQRAAASWGRLSATSRERMCQSAMSTVENIETNRTSTIARGRQRCISQAARIGDGDPHDLEVLVHVE